MLPEGAFQNFVESTKGEVVSGRRIEGRAREIASGERIPGLEVMKTM